MNAAGPATGSQARGLAVTVALATVLAVAGVARTGQSPGIAVADCDERLALRMAQGTRQVCAGDPLLVSCPLGAAGDLVELADGDCHLIRHGMAAADRLAVGIAVDVNRASAADLELIDGIGPTLAERIIAYRREHGPFSMLTDLERIKGIGPKTLVALQSKMSAQ